jgi:hypothetical protein
MYTQSAFSLVAKAGDNLRIGVKGSSNQGNDSWVIWDNFKLTYLGKDITYVKPTLKEALIDAQNILIDPETGLEKPIGKDAYEILQKAIEEAQAAYDSDDASMFDKLAALVSVDVDASAAKFAALKNTFLKYEANINEAEAADASNKPSAATIAEAWELHDEIMEGLDGRTLTDADADRLTEEMAAMTKKLQIPAIMDEASDDQPANATYMITNPKYADNAKDGWSGTEAAVDNHEAEIFGKNFDYYQDIENMKPGTYRVSLQGFYRAGGFVNDYKSFVENPEANNNAFLYATTAEGTSSAPLLRLASEAIEQDLNAAVPSGWAAAKTDTIDATADPVSVIYTVVPNNMAEAEKCFASEDAAYNYTGCEIFVKVGEDGKLRIGVKKETNIDDNWTIWTNWQLTYYGANSSKAVSGDPSGINATTGGNVVKTEFFSLSGAQIEKPAKGVAIMKQTLSDGSVNVQKVIVK